MSRVAEMETNHSVLSKAFEVRTGVVLTLSFCLHIQASSSPNVDHNLYLTYISTTTF
jgi:hypothetical protein